MGRSSIDLHMHSTVSDGTDSPEELIRNVKKAGIETYALTDHDTIKGALMAERILEDSKQDLEFFRGIEFSCETDDEQKQDCHLLGFEYDPKDPVFAEAAEDAHQIRMDKTENRLKALKEHGIRLSEEDVETLRNIPSPGKPQIADYMLKNGFPGDRNQAIDYIGKIEKKMRMPSGAVIRAIIHSGGIPVWAHPLGETFRDRISYEECDRRMRLLIGEGIMGIECWYSKYGREDVDFLLRQADKYHLLISGGSDYHGSRKTVKLGQLNDFGEEVGCGDLTVLSKLREIRMRQEKKKE